MSKKKKRKVPRKFDPNRCDWHHFLWIKSKWNTGYAKRLREHPYCGAYIPQMTLHREIHQELSNVPLPDGKYCKQALEAINSWLEAGFISLDDPVEKKIEMLIKCFKVNCPNTAKVLEKQRQIVSEFYRRGA
ncbi:MAG: hypothetical protein Q4A15_10405 [Prevotellaceae bacterium]|nr:hypothetical protein [Prevotellaceae bacterium]